jgi:hypothetical protein
MTLWMHIAKWIFGTLAVLALTVFATLYSCAYFFCDNKIVAELLSPDGKYKAVVFVKDCGATTTWSTHISVIRWWNWVGRNDAGNAFVMDDGDGAPEGPGHGPEARIRWTSGRALAVSHHPQAKIFRAENQVDGVTINYTYFSE